MADKEAPDCFFSSSLAPPVPVTPLNGTTQGGKWISNAQLGLCSKGKMVLAKSITQNGIKSSRSGGGMERKWRRKLQHGKGLIEKGDTSIRFLSLLYHHHHRGVVEILNIWWPDRPKKYTAMFSSSPLKPLLVIHWFSDFPSRPSFIVLLCIYYHSFVSHTRTMHINIRSCPELPLFSQPVVVQAETAAGSAGRKTTRTIKVNLPPMSCPPSIIEYSTALPSLVQNFTYCPAARLPPII